MYKAGNKVNVSFAREKFRGKITRVGANRGKDTKLQIQKEEGGKPLWYPSSAIVEEPNYKATLVGENIIRFLQENTENTGEVNCKTVDEISDSIGKTQPQVKSTLKSLSNNGLVLVGVCKSDNDSVSLTKEGFDYKCGEPVKMFKLTKEGKKVTKKDRIIAAYYEGLTNRQITERVGCDPSYPSWLIKEEISKGNITPREENKD